MGLKSFFSKDKKEETGIKENLINPNIQGRVRIGKNCKISDSAVIRGPVVIGNNCTIESAVFIGPYTSIKNNVHIKKGEIEKLLEEF